MDDTNNIQSITYGRHAIGTLDIPDYLRFLLALFGPDEIVLFRPIETWNEGGKKQSRVIYKRVAYRAANPALLMMTTEQLLQTSELEKANVFFGVCPRLGDNGRFDLAWQIRQINCLWADIDHAGVEEVLKRCAEAELPAVWCKKSSGQ